MGVFRDGGPRMDVRLLSQGSGRAGVGITSPLMRTVPEVPGRGAMWILRRNGSSAFVSRP